MLKAKDSCESELATRDDDDHAVDRKRQSMSNNSDTNNKYFASHCNLKY